MLFKQNTPEKIGVLIIMSIFLIFTPQYVERIFRIIIFLTVSNFF